MKEEEEKDISKEAKVQEETTEKKENNEDILREASSKGDNEIIGDSLNKENNEIVGKSSSKEDNEIIGEFSNKENNQVIEDATNEESKKIVEEAVNKEDEESKLDKNKTGDTDLAKDKTDEKIETKEYKPEESKLQKNKKTIGIVIGIVVIAIIVMFFSIIFALLNINNEKILQGISILGIDVSDLTAEEAKQRVNEAIQEKFNNANDNIILKHGDAETGVSANTFNAKFDIDTAVAEAYNIGRKGNIITDNYAILYTKLFKRQIEPQLHYDKEFMNSTIKDVEAKMKDAVVEYSYYIENDKLIVVKGKDGYVIKVDELEEKIINQLKNIHIPYEEIDIPVESKEASAIDLEKIRNEIYKEPKDAYVEKNPTKVHVEEDGIDFGISMEVAKKLLLDDKKEYEIPLKITKPKKKLSDLGEEAFPNQLATFSTIYDASSKNRAYNVELATKKINGTVIMPGETFSYNKTVGSRTIEAGWKEGTAYISGKVVPSVGGGVCQVSSTLYNTALLANLEITERTNHTFTVDYVAASRDATVYYGSLDFCFKNTRNYPVKIVATANNGVCKISLYGIKEEVEYEVIIQSKITSYINRTTIYKEDPTLEEGKEKIIQYGFNGCRSEGYKILKLNGKVVSQTLLSKDTYSPQERIVKRGTKKVVQTTTNQ